ncbi:hypothetical protein THAOC_20809 [Thalassiosira oceanica]|uniref:Uncharacterized protein n=1 Tax=Thalassiosira oceanica TaxID=159749 RepID=K0SKP6_THAOC|nr:hypothetical protein THAOC_20809 [Thalassiosira oceanica]|eukprot:EJK59027.1 hypothetical protein THAOC_20809 [Thalassiosira oceanica]
MDDGQSDAKRRRVRAPHPRGGVTTRTLEDIHSVLEEHARRIEKLVAANKVLMGRNAALEETCKALDRKSKSLGRACDELEVRCSSLERSIQVLKKDANWTYSAPDVPRSHWIEQGHDEEYADNVGGTIRNIKRDARRIRDGDEDYHCNCLDNESQLTILHDNGMLPHFKDLADAIQLSNGILQQINIVNIELRPSALRILFPAMEGKNGVNGCRALAALMRCGSPLDLLDFSGNGLSGTDDVAAALASNPQLDILDLTENQLNDRDAELIAQALKQNTNLKMLSLLGGNSITPAGFGKIRTTICDPSSLNAMESCNHTCHVDCVEQNGHYRGGNFKGMASQQRRRRKLYKLLSARHEEGSNARHLNAELGEGPFAAKLVPRVLECIEQCSVDRSSDTPTPLSLYFELMKSWKMPELFEHRNIV